MTPFTLIVNHIQITGYMRFRNFQLSRVGRGTQGFWCSTKLLHDKKHVTDMAFARLMIHQYKTMSLSQGDMLEFNNGGLANPKCLT